MTWTIARHRDGEGFLARAGAWLAEREAENNLILGIAARLTEGDHHFGSPVYLATVEREGSVEGCAWRTPPHKAGLTRMPVEAAAAVAADMAEVYEGLPAVLGDPSVAGAFARAWCALRPVDPRPGMRMRIHVAREVTPPHRPAPGALRPAAPADRDLLVRWWEAFAAEAGVSMTDASLEAVDRRIARGDVWLWVDGGPVCLAGVAGRSPTGARIGPVYTPPESRGRGYATSAVAELSDRQLAGDRSVCFLYTDLANPTSNSIYAAVGYLPVCDVTDIHFEER